MFFSCKGVGYGQTSVPNETTFLFGGIYILNKNEKDHVIAKLQGFFYDERGETLGLIGAENLYHFIVEEIAPLIYNSAIEDARLVANRQMDSLQEELEVLKKIHKKNK